MTHVILSYDPDTPRVKNQEVERLYTVNRIDTSNRLLTSHSIIAHDDHEAIDLAMIICGADRAQVWQSERLVHEIEAFRFKRRPLGY